MRSTANPNLIECVPRVRKASSYPWNEFQPKIELGNPSTPPKNVVSPDTTINGAAFPGIDPKEVSVSVVGNQLTIEGERKHEEKKEEKDYFYQELSYGKFSRSMTVPEGVEADKVKATFKNGVLEVTMPAPKQLAAKKIQVEAQK